MSEQLDKAIADLSKRADDAYAQAILATNIGHHGTASQHRITAREAIKDIEALHKLKEKKP